MWLVSLLSAKVAVASSRSCYINEPRIYFGAFLCQRISPENVRNMLSYGVLRYSLRVVFHDRRFYEDDK